MKWNLDRMVAGCPLHDFEPCKGHKCLFFLPYNNPEKQNEYSCLFVGTYFYAQQNAAYAFSTHIQSFRTGAEPAQPLNAEGKQVLLEGAQDLLEDLEQMQSWAKNQVVLAARVQQSLKALQNTVEQLKDDSD